MKIGKTLFFIGLFISWAFVVGLFIVGFLMIGPEPTNIKNNLNIKVNSSSLTSNSNSPVDLTLAEVSKHNVLSNCWMIISDKVYDITPYSSSHPGGLSEIELGCGKDATQLYDTKNNKGSPHSSNAQSLLTNYYIGDLNSKISSSELQNKTATIANTPPPSRYDDD